MTHPRWVQLSLVLVGVSVMVGVTATWTLLPRFSGANIRLRGWMVVIGAVVGGVHMVALAATALAVRRRPPLALIWGAAACLAAASVWLIMQHVETVYAPDSVEIRTIRVLALAPSIVRDLGLLLLARTLVRPAVAQVAQLAVAASLGFSVWIALEPHPPVLPRAHALEHHPVGLALWALGLAVCIYGLQPGSETRAD